MKLFRIFSAAVGALALTMTASAAGGAKHAHAPEKGWSFASPTGQLDKKAMQRGYQVYREVCASCHGMKLLSYRNLGEKGGPFYDELYPNADDNLLVKAFAAEDEILDPVPDDAGDYVYRPARPSDVFRSPYPNEQAARAANGGAYPPDLSVITKARCHGEPGSGASYVYSLLSGYPDPDKIKTKKGEDGLNINYIEFDKDETVGTLIQPNGQYYNPYMSGDSSANWQGDPRHVPYGGFLAMATQLSDGRVEYMDGTEATISQMASDVAHFLQWAGEPHYDARKKLGLPVVLYLLFFAILLWFSYKRIWRNVDH